MSFFRISLPVDPTRLQSNFENVLARHNIAASSSALDSLFANLRTMCSSDCSNLDSPFPLVKSESVAHNHAKKIKNTLHNNAELKLGKCQQVLADFYGFRKWDFFTAALQEFSNGQFREKTQANSDALQSDPIAGVTQKANPAQSELPAVEAKSNRQRSLSQSSMTASNVKANHQWSIDQAELRELEEDALRQWDIVQAEQRAAEEDALRQWNNEQAELRALEEEALRQWDNEQAELRALEEEALRQWDNEQAELRALEEEALRDIDQAALLAAEAAFVDYDYSPEDDYIFSQHTWVDELDREIRDFASQFGSKEEFEEYMESI